MPAALPLALSAHQNDLLRNAELMLLKQEDSMTYFVDEVVLPSVAMPPSAEWHVVRYVLLFLPDMVSSRSANALEIPYCPFCVLEVSESLHSGKEMGLFTYLVHVCASKFPWGHDRLHRKVGAIVIQISTPIILHIPVTAEGSLHSSNT